VSKKKPVILGPDGRPYVAPRKPQAESRPVGTKVELAGVDISDSVSSFTFEYGGSLGSIYGRLFASPERTKKDDRTPLADAVAQQVADLASDFDGQGIEELPKPERDLHTYADAFASARENCQHPDVESTMYARQEFYCPDCRRYINAAEYRRTRTGFGRYFG
jgi:hypothetical protein